MNKDERIVSIDRFRGIMLLLMVLFQFFRNCGCFGILGRFAYQTENGILLFKGFTAHDIAVGVFFFAVALCFEPSFKKRKELYGKKAAYVHLLERGLFITGCGTCIRTITLVFDYFGDWSTFSIHFLFCVIFTAACIISVIVTLVLSKSQKWIKTTKILLCLNGIACIIYGMHNLIQLLYGAELVTKIWSVLPAVGFAIIIAIPAADMSTLHRGIYSAVLFVLYAIGYSIPRFREMVDIEVQGGFLGSFSWASMLLIFTVFSDLYFMDKEDIKAGKRALRYPIAILVSVIIGFIGFRLFEVDKETVSPGYVLVSLPIVTALFGLVAIFDSYKPKFCPLIWWGENPLFIYIMNYLLIDVPIALFPFFKTVGIAVNSVYIILVITFLTFICFKMDRKNRYIKL